MVDQGGSRLDQGSTHLKTPNSNITLYKTQNSCHTIHQGQPAGLGPLLKPQINIIHKRNLEHLITLSSGNHHAGPAVDKGGGGGVHEGGRRRRKRKVRLRRIREDDAPAVTSY